MTPEQETAVDRLDAQTDWQEICERNCINTGDGVVADGEFRHGNIDREGSTPQDGEPLRLQEVQSPAQSGQDRPLERDGEGAQASREGGYSLANALKPSPNRIRCAQYVNLARWPLDKLMWAALLDIILGGVLCAVWSICVRIQEAIAR